MGISRDSGRIPYHVDPTCGDATLRSLTQLIEEKLCNEEPIPFDVGNGWTYSESDKDIDDIMMLGVLTKGDNKVYYTQLSFLVGADSLLCTLKKTDLEALLQDFSIQTPIHKNQKVIQES
jgi:hypothetical protein